MLRKTVQRRLEKLGRRRLRVGYGEVGGNRQFVRRSGTKKLCMDLHESFIRVRSWPSLKVFILELIQIDVHCHLEVTIAQQRHFGIKSTVSQKR